jgi:hypothetical protein
VPWNAHWDGWRITCYRPDGKVERVLKVPVPKPTAVAFGGKDMKRLYITTASIGMSEVELAESPWSGCLRPWISTSPECPTLTTPRHLRRSRRASQRVFPEGKYARRGYDRGHERATPSSHYRG